MLNVQYPIKENSPNGEFCRRMLKLLVLSSGSFSIGRLWVFQKELSLRNFLGFGFSHKEII